MLQSDDKEWKRAEAQKPQPYTPPCEAPILRKLPEPEATKESIVRAAQQEEK